MALFSSAHKSPNRPRRNDDGYIMLTLLLMVSLIAITLTAVLPAISYQIRRDQEQEMIHRGVQYTRAIRAYFKKFGRYPARLEDLDNTSNARYLRRRYKDPITGKDFKLLHYGEQGVTLAGGIAGGTIPGANAIGAQGGLNGSNGGFGGGPAGSGFGNSGFGNTGVNNSGVFSQSQSPGSQSSGFGANSNSTPGQPGANPATGSDPSQASTQAKGTGEGDDSSSGQQPVAGGAIVGVASISKKTGFHEFNHKKKYNEWQFIYDPGTDRGGLITTPNQPTLQGFGSAGMNNTQQGTPGNSPFGQSSFGQSSPGQSSFGQSGGGLNSNQSSMPQPPQSNPPQQQ
jgi:type II secretory pathway pseudopilin PulG